MKFLFIFVFSKNLFIILLFIFPNYFLLPFIIFTLLNSIDFTLLILMLVKKLFILIVKINKNDLCL